MVWVTGTTRRGAAGVLAIVLGLAGVVVSGGSSAPPPPVVEGLKELGASRADPAAPPMAPPRSAALVGSTPAGTVDVRLPAPWAGVVTLTDDLRPAQAGGSVGVAARTAQAAGGRVRVEVLDRAATLRAGATALLTRLSLVDKPAGDGLPVRVSIDYSGLGRAYGGGYADRLRVRTLPECALATPPAAGCRPGGEALPAHNDVRNRRLEADVTLAGATVLAVSADASGDGGNFAATPLSPSGEWQVSPGSGEFSWSYDIPVPQPPIGTAPAVGLSYSSGSVDGLVSTRNSQGPQSGVGWSDFIPGFVERRYTVCADTGDYCWKSHNAVISLNGRSSELIPLDPTRTLWRLKDDPDWRVEHLHGTVANGDENKEYWKVITPDGTQYYFGLGANPDTGAATGSVWTVPVFADNSGEPCRGPGDTLSACDQAWRWNLDRIVDRNGITTTHVYLKETNRYRTMNGLGNVSAGYTRSGRLVRIEYGKPQGTGPEVAPAAQVTFEAQHRCRSLSSNCPAPELGNGDLFPDVPNDLICTTPTCLVTTPTFFSGKRYSAVRTEVRVGGQWRVVAQVNLSHSFRTNADGDEKIHLAAIQRVGLAEGAFLVMPAVELGYIQMPNRVDRGSGKLMGHYRLNTITDEYGARTVVTYGQKSTCPETKVGASVRWDLNTQDCFPQKFRDKWATFHKYLTTRVEERDLTGGSPTRVTTYTYEDTPAWHHDDDEFVPLADQNWSGWRGYATTVVMQGSSRTRLRVFRGMHNDRLAVGGPRTVRIEPFDGAGFDAVPVVNDEPWLAGTVLVEAQLGPLGDVLNATLHEYTERFTLQPGSDPQDYAVWVGESTTTTSAARAVNQFDLRRSTTTYNANYQPETLYEEGWVGRTGDERCTRTTYAVNQSARLLALPATVELVAGGCSSTTRLSHRETYYDGSTTLGAAPTRGNATRQRVRVDASRLVTTATTTYDAWGRVVSVTDARGLVTSTAHEATPNGGFPRTSTTTVQVGANLFTSSTDWLPEHGVPVKQTDANGNVTTYGYDGLGRLHRVRRPTEQPLVTGKPPSWEFTYQISPDKSAPPVVRSRSVASADLTTFADAWVVYDSYLRERQTHALSPEAGKVIVTGTSYDDRGLVLDRTSPQAVVGTAGAGLLSVSWANRTRTLHDTVGRVTREGWYHNGTEQWATVTSYTHDTTTVEKPGGRLTRTVVDGLGREVEVADFDGTAWRSATYGHDLADRLTSRTDPAGNRTTYTYNLAGWRLAQDDPDAGAWSYTYTDAGDTALATDARGRTTFTAYDQLGRPVERRQDGSSGAVLARWEYDAAGEKGLLNRTIRPTAQGQWIVDVAGYDGRGRPLGQTWTVPSGVPGLSGNYAVRYAYDPADRITSVTYPAVGQLPAETVTTRYTAAGLPDRLAGLDEYVWAATYDDRARPKLFGFGPHPGGQAWLAKEWSYDADQRLARARTVVNGGVTTDHQFGYDQIGNIAARTTQFGAETWRECYAYDPLDRLLSAHTTTATACGTQRGTGPRPYDHTYAYTVDGNLATRVQNGVTSVYTYPGGTGADRPHAPTAVSGASYVWDANGNLTGRTVGGQAETLTWDAERQLASIDGPSGTNTFLYNADGVRLLRTTPAGRTLYIDGHEITANPAGTTVTATRSYAFGDEVVATRTPAGVDYLVSDQQGSVEASLPSGAGLDVSRTYNPYGQKRSGGQMDTDQAWIGQIEDDATGLSYLNARYYDPVLSRFISPDPLVDTERPQTHNRYSYGLNSPTTKSDPTGLWIPINAHGTKGAYDERWSEKTKVREIAYAKKIFTRSHKPLRTFIVQVAAKRAKYLASDLHKRRQAALMMRKLALANPDPAFWRALAQAGSGQALILMGLRAANPDPGFWKFMAAMGKGGALDTPGRPQIYGYVGNRAAPNDWPWDCPIGHNDDGGCRGGDIGESIENFAGAIACAANEISGNDSHNRPHCEATVDEYLADAGDDIKNACVDAVMGNYIEEVVGGALDAALADGKTLARAVGLAARAGRGAASTALVTCSAGIIYTAGKGLFS